MAPHVRGTYPEAVTAGWRSLWREPRPVDPPPVGRRDWLLAGGFAVTCVVESLARSGMPSRPLVIALALGLAPAFLWRRRHPLLACVIGFGGAALLSLLQVATHHSDVGPTSMIAIVILLYSLVRWGSGREIAIGTTIVGVVVSLGIVVAEAKWADLIGGILFVLLFVALGAVVRIRADQVDRQQREARNDERLALARELHDTVAHHISAIAVQAQAGGVVAAREPQRAAQILAAIETEASRTLTEMRTMVRLLREDGTDDYAPDRGVADLPALARSDAIPTIDISVAISAETLPRPVDIAIYRIVQESLTNALRHARQAARVSVECRQVGEMVSLRVVDDGKTDPGHPVQPGFGLTGMAERAHLFGGSLTAGPGPYGGWVVEATLPTGDQR